MKKLFALPLAILILCSLAACGNAPESTSGVENHPSQLEQEEMVTIYVVTEQIRYVNGEISSTATFEYDDHGRPVMVQFVEADGRGKRSDLVYDEQGNLVGDYWTYLYADENNSTTPTDWSLTYSDGLLTRAERPQDEDAYALKFSYDSEKRLVLVEYLQPNESVGGYLWQNYEYDQQGRLIREARCTLHVAGVGAYTNEYQYRQICYFYDEQGRLTEQYSRAAASKTDVKPEGLDELDLKVSLREHYFFYYDEEGKLAYVGEGEEDAYPGGSAEIYSDEKYTFDENGNLVRIEKELKSGQTEPDRIEYTYKAMEVSKSDAIMHRRLIHGISRFTLPHTDYNTMDPIFWELCPPALYSYHLCSMNFYYLIPYPQFELFR